jgi:fatty-acyl-CoA synthase
MDHLRAHLARYKVPRVIELVDLPPRAATGEAQKFELREKEWAGHSSRTQG